MAELRHLLGALRDPDPEPGSHGSHDPGSAADLRPPAGLADLPDLVTATAGAGVRVDLAVVGAPLPLPPGVDLAAYRIVQESLTNVVKHAAADRAHVVLTYRTGELAIETTDAGRGRTTAAHAAGGKPDGRLDQRTRVGHGLTGMRERVELYGGILDVGPLPGRGFRVAATLPVDPPGPR